MVRVVEIHIQIKPFIVSKSSVVLTRVQGWKWCTAEPMLRDRLLLESYWIFFLKNWRDLDFYEQKFQETREISCRKSEMSCESHWEENVSLVDGNKWHGHLVITDSLLCPWNKKALTFSLNSTPFYADTLSGSSVSLLTGFDCICNC